MSLIARLSFVAALLFSLAFSLSFQTNDCANIPSVNKKIIAFVKTKIGKKCGSYCNALFDEAHKAAGLDWWGDPTGTKIDYTKECVYPGDMISLRNVELTWKRNDSLVGLVYDNTTITYFIYKVKARGVYNVVRTHTINGQMKVVAQGIEINKFKGSKPVIKRPGTPNTMD